ncbi:hypothetical protein BX667DRAFT_516160 [Coemansia mojavensis]|nr:hypothetical protein BX667DRAFT_516160 [Coemansia mojavensis]
MGHSVECGKYLVERVLYPEEKQQLETEDVYIATIAPAQTSRREQLDALIQNTEWAMLDISIGQVPKTPPYTREQLEQWKQIWPVTYRPPPKLKNLEFEADEKAYIEMCLQMTEKLKSAASGNRPVAVVIGNSQLRRVIAQATDTTYESKNPLNHAVMNCIANVAEIEVARLADGSEVPTKRSHEQSEHELGQNEEPDTFGYLCEGLDSLPMTPEFMLNVGFWQYRLNKFRWGFNHAVDASAKGICIGITTASSLWAWCL